MSEEEEVRSRSQKKDAEKVQRGKGTGICATSGDKSALTAEERKKAFVSERMATAFPDGMPPNGDPRRVEYLQLHIRLTQEAGRLFHQLE